MSYARRWLVSSGRLPASLCAKRIENNGNDNTTSTSTPSAAPTPKRQASVKRYQPA